MLARTCGFNIPKIYPLETNTLPCTNDSNTLCFQTGNLPASINGEPDVLSGLLRRYLRELPEPLVPAPHYKALLSILTSSKKFKNGKDRGGIAAVKQIVEANDFNRVHYHALRRVLGLLRMMLTSWWSDSGEGQKIVEIMAVNIMRPDNLNRSVSSHKEMSSIREAVTNLIIHSSAIFVLTNTSGVDITARRISMIRRGERASRLHLQDEDASAGNLSPTSNGNGGDFSSRRRLSSFSHSDTPRGDTELRTEFRAFKEATNTQIASLLETVAQLRLEIDGLKRRELRRDGSDIFASAQGSEFEDTPPVTPHSYRRADSNPKMPVMVVGTDVPRTKLSSRSLIDTDKEPKKRSSNRSLVDSVEKEPSKKASSRSLEHPKKAPKTESQDEDGSKDDTTHKKHKSKKKGE